MRGSLPAAVDVLVVGYGPVGAALACLLGRHDVSTLVIDKAPDILMSPRAIALDNEALRILQLAGLGDDAFARVVIPHVRMHCPYVGEFSCINTRGTIDDHPKLVTFYQPDLERALRAQAKSHTGVTAATGVELLDFSDDGTQVRARVKNADGQVHTVVARFLVGADGASSMVRKAIGQDFVGQTYGEDWLIIDAQDVPGNFDHVEFLCDHRRPTPHMVAPGGRIRWEFMLNPGETREDIEKEESVQRLLAPWAKGGAIRIERKAVYRFHARSCERYSKGRVFLVGDAAHVTPPFVGQGLVSGLRDAANLAWKLAWVLQGRADAPILDSYDQERRPHATEMIALAKLMGSFVMPRNAVMAILIHGLLRLLRMIPGLRGWLEELGVKPKPNFAHGLFVRGRGKLRRGGMIAQARVPSAIGTTARSDELLSRGFTLVGFGVEPKLSPQTAAAWRQQGGEIRRFDAAPFIAPAGTPWCAVIRPDRTVLHDGPAARADAIATESMARLRAA